MGMEKVSEAFGMDNQIQNRVKRYYDLAMDGVITKKNAINSLTLQYQHTDNFEIRESIIKKIELINQREGF